MPFHPLISAHDAHGILPSVFATTSRGTRDRKTFARPPWDIPDADTPIELEQTTLQQGPLRHADIVEWSGDGSPIGHYMVVSSRVHQLFQAARLPPHRTRAVTLRWPASRRAKKSDRDALPAWLYLFSRHVELECLDLANTALVCTVRLLSARADHTHAFSRGAFVEPERAAERAEALCPKGQLPLVIPQALHAPMINYEPQLDFDGEHFPLQLRDLDLVFLSHSFKPWLSDGLREALERMEATGFGFDESWGSERLLAPEPAPARIRELERLAEAHAGAVQLDPSFQRLAARRQRILTRRDRVQRSREARDELDAVEDRLDVLLPPAYREALLAKRLPKRGKFRFYAASELRSLDDVDPAWSEKSRPEAVRAVLIAEDAHGDFLALLLREDSDTELDTVVMRLHHETGDITRRKGKKLF